MHILLPSGLTAVGGDITMFITLHHFDFGPWFYLTRCKCVVTSVLSLFDSPSGYHHSQITELLISHHVAKLEVPGSYEEVVLHG